MGRAWVPEAIEVQDTTICWHLMATLFWDAKDVIMLDFLPKRNTITGVYYANLLNQLRTAIRKNAEVNSLMVFCCNRTTSEPTLAKLQRML